MVSNDTPAKPAQDVVILEDYFLSCIDLSDYDRTEYPTLKSIIEAEKPAAKDAPVSQAVVQDWLQGLPSACTIEFNSYEIAQLIKRSNKPHFSEKLYWSHAAFIIRRHAIIRGN